MTSQAGIAVMETSTTNLRYLCRRPKLGRWHYSNLSRLFYSHQIDAVLGLGECVGPMAEQVAIDITYADRRTEDVTCDHLSHLNGQVVLPEDLLSDIKSQQSRRVLIVAEQIDETNRATVRAIVEELFKVGAAVELGAYHASDGVQIGDGRVLKVLTPTRG